MKITRNILTLGALCALALTASGCIYATHAPGEGTQLVVGPPPVIEIGAPAVVYAPGPVYYGPRPYYGRGWHHGHWHH